jgi:hypothetical protein
MKMADCEVLATCPFFNDKMENMPGTATILKPNTVRETI